MPEIVILHGTPGSGKTTQAQRFTELHADGVFHVSIGNQLREIRLGKIPSRFKKNIDAQANKLAQSAPLDHEIVNGVVFEFIEQCPSTATILIDGYPRFIEQLSFFYKSMERESCLYLGLIALSVSQETSLARLTHRGTRSGEKEVEENFATWRFSEYQKKTIPVIGLLGAMTQLIKIDAELPEEDVWHTFNEAARNLIFKS